MLWTFFTLLDFVLWPSLPFLTGDCNSRNDFFIDHIRYSLWFVQRHRPVCVEVPCTYTSCARSSAAEALSVLFRYHGTTLARSLKTLQHNSSLSGLYCLISKPRWKSLDGGQDYKRRGRGLTYRPDQYHTIFRSRRKLVGRQHRIRNGNTFTIVQVRWGRQDKPADVFCHETRPTGRINLKRRLIEKEPTLWKRKTVFYLRVGPASEEESDARKLRGLTESRALDAGTGTPPATTKAPATHTQPAPLTYFRSSSPTHFPPAPRPDPRVKVILKTVVSFFLYAWRTTGIEKSEPQVTALPTQQLKEKT
ncbi:hypothetical protein BT69DRAFT_1297902 [Atractiella rhizophila]|nr:hypothetical protein BT69DRAFT_1297902 [Atractiella rhizophila]